MKTFSKSSIPLMRADTQFAVVEATLKGYNRWISSHGKAPQQDVWTSLYYIERYTVDRINRSNCGVIWRLLWSLGHSAYCSATLRFDMSCYRQCFPQC